MWVTSACWTDGALRNCGGCASRNATPRECTVGLASRKKNWCLTFKTEWPASQHGISSFSIAPLRVSTLVGVVVSIAAFLYMCKVLIKTIFWGDPVQGYSSLMVVMLFLGGIQLISLGIIGEYLGKTYIEVKNRPVYVVDRYIG